LLLTLGWSVGRNWQQVAHALQLYGTIITAVVVALVGGWFLWNWLQSRRNAERKLP
jgi:membrane protein DedA with SNARE-associated domain